MGLECLASICLVCKLLSKRFDNVAKTILQSLVHLSEVSLLVKRVLEVLNPSRKLVLEITKGSFKIAYSSLELSESFLTDTTTGCFRNLQVGKGLVESLELLLKRCDSCLKFLEVSILEVFELGTQPVCLVLKSLGRLVDLL